jgi:hypothetical protein
MHPLVQKGLTEFCFEMQLTSSIFCHNFVVGENYLAKILDSAPLISDEIPKS